MELLHGLLEVVFLNINKTVAGAITAIFNDWTEIIKQWLLKY